MKITDSKVSALRNSPAEKEQLSQDAWLDAAGIAIAEGGFDNVRVLTLAKKLGVSRGSFYWHFQDHAEFITSFLNRWHDHRLRDLDYLQPSGKSTEAELRRIVRFVLSEPARKTPRMRVELAIRDYARRDAHAANIVANVDRARMAQYVSLLETLTSDKERARNLSLLLYVAIIGGQVVLTGSRDGEAAINRIENLITEIVTSEAKQP